MTREVLAGSAEVAETMAVRLLDHVVALQATEQRDVHIGLTGGTIATKAYERLGALALP